MNLNWARQKLAACLLLLLMGAGEHGWAAPQTTTGKCEVADAISALKSLSIQRMEKLGPRTGAEVLRLRDIFLRYGDDSGRLLVTQLEQLNADEWKHVSGPDDIDGGLEYTMSATLDDQNPFLKVHIVNLLADLYPQLSSEVQAVVLQTMAASYTPSTHETFTAGSINYAFHRIGAPSLPYLIGLLSNQSKFVRCNARDALDNLVPEPVQREASLPKLPCEEVLSDRSEPFAAWMSWWKQKKGQIPVEKVPSFLEMVYKPVVHP